MARTRPAVRRRVTAWPLSLTATRDNPTMAPALATPPRNAIRRRPSVLCVATARATSALATSAVALSPLATAWSYRLAAVPADATALAMSDAALEALAFKVQPTARADLPCDFETASPRTDSA